MKFCLISLYKQKYCLFQNKQKKKKQTEYFVHVNIVTVTSVNFGVNNKFTLQQSDFSSDVLKASFINTHYTF